MIFDATSARIGLRRPTLADSDEFLAMMQASRAFHEPWGDYPATPERFAQYIHTRQSATHDGFLICNRETHVIMGVINLNEIVRGLFQSTYLGYYIGSSFARQGYMTEALTLLSQYAFTQMNLHRLEANIQPHNTASIALVRKCGFHKEGFSPRYLKINGQWRDHERWALLADA